MHLEYGCHIMSHLSDHVVLMLMLWCWSFATYTVERVGMLIGRLCNQRVIAIACHIMLSVLPKPCCCW